MRKGPRAAAAFVLLPAALLTAAVAPPPPPAADPAPLVDELADLNRSVDRLAGLLERLIQHQRVDLLIKRIELRDRRIEPMQRRVRSLESDVESAESEIRQLETMGEQFEQQRREELREGTGLGESDAQRMRNELELMLKVQNERLDEARRRLRAAEDELAENREDIVVLDELLVDLLEQLERSGP